MNKCNICEIEKELSEFHKHSGRKDGYVEQCKICNNAMRKNKLKEIKSVDSDEYKEFRKKANEANERYKNGPKRLVLLEKERNWHNLRYRKNPEHYRKIENSEEKKAYKKKWTEENRDRTNARNREEYKNNPEVKQKIKMRAKVYQALKTGKLVRPDECSKCSWKGKIEAHHEDYEKPLEVTWLCVACHKKIHQVYK